MEDMTGKIYGDLTVIKFSHYDKKRNSYWLCKCSCGKEKIVRRTHLISGGVSSCGCQKPIKCGNASRKHGVWAKNKRIYKIWECMNRSCYNEQNPNYPWYGGKGVTVCEEWKNDILSFYTWAISSGYTDELTIDRINCNGNYEPTNCRWIPFKEQCLNTTRTTEVTIDGVTDTISHWLKFFDTPTKIFRHRLKDGYNLLEAIRGKQ